LAEGVETEPQRSTLLERRCILAQGSLFHRPLDANTFAALLKPRPETRRTD